MGFIVVGEHAQIVSYPQCNEVAGAIATDPSPIASQHVVILHVYILNEPFHALSIVIVPCAVATSFFRPDVYHFPYK